MANETVSNAEEVKKETEKKIVRRGIGSARGTTRLKFSHEQAKPNGLFIGHLDNVVVTTSKIGEDSTGIPSFNGYEIPRIAFTFASNEEDVNKRHYVTLFFNAVESNVETIPGAKDEWKVNTVFDWIKHILNVFVLKGREMTEEENAALSLPFIDFDENGEYVAVDTEEVINGWKYLFDNVENILNRGKDGKPYYLDSNGKFIPLWIKLIRYRRQGKKGWSEVNNGDLAFPTFVGEGCIEEFKPNVLPSIKLDAVKETILPMKIEKAKTPNMNNAVANTANAMGAMPVVDPMMGTGAGFGNIGMEAAEDMPF